MIQSPFLKVYTKIGVARVGEFGGWWETYSWNKRNESWEDESGNGYSLSFFEKHGEKPHIMNSFVFGDSIESIDKKIKEKEFVAKFGPKNKKDSLIHCPNCNWAFNTPDPMGNCEYDSFQDEICKRVNCICGHSFNFEVKFEIKVKQVTVR